MQSCVVSYKLSHTQVGNVFLVGAAVLDWPLVIVNFGAHVGDTDSSLLLFPDPVSRQE